MIYYFTPELILMYYLILGCIISIICVLLDDSDSTFLCYLFIPLWPAIPIYCITDGKAHITFYRWMKGIKVMPRWTWRMYSVGCSFNPFGIHLGPLSIYFTQEAE